MAAHPAGGHRPKRSLGTSVDGKTIAPQGRVMVHDPATPMIHVMRGDGAGHRNFFQPLEERGLCLREIRDFGWPVIHLGVDVHCVAGGPGWNYFFVPDAL